MAPKPKPTKQTKKPKAPKVKKLDPDKLFSLCVRERADWTCEACGKKYEPWAGADGYPANPGLHCSHYIGRANYATRFDPLNVFAHCYGCHAKFEGNPHVFREWVLSRIGTESYDVVIEKSNNLMLGKQARQEKQHIAEFYKNIFQALRYVRNNGQTGRLEFTGYL
jgi:hypothetical protein